ncbi:MAG: CBS domain-containing protein [Burkholderiaceae bacterium]
MSIHAILPTARTRLVTIQDAAPVIDAAKLLSGKHTSLVVVCSSDGAMSGVVTKADVVRQISTCAGCSCTTMVSDIMTREVITCHPEDNLIDVWATMKDNALRQIPISDRESRPVGLLYANDALQVLLKEADDEDLLLRDYMFGIGYR